MPGRPGVQVRSGPTLVTGNEHPGPEGEAGLCSLIELLILRLFRHRRIIVVDPSTRARLMASRDKSTATIPLTIDNVNVQLSDVLDALLADGAGNRLMSPRRTSTFVRMNCSASG